MCVVHSRINVSTLLQTWFYVVIVVIVVVDIMCVHVVCVYFGLSVYTFQCVGELVTFNPLCTQPRCPSGTQTIGEPQLPSCVQDIYMYVVC